MTGLRGRGYAVVVVGRWMPRCSSGSQSQARNVQGQRQSFNKYGNLMTLVRFRYGISHENSISRTRNMIPNRVHPIGVSSFSV